jgi:hypothetical protein
MKKIFLGLWFMVLSISLTTAQNRGFNYKALLADNGTALNNQNVSLKFTVLESGTMAVYQEIHTTTTDGNGIISVSIGEGTVVSGDFNTIDWASHPYFLKVEIDTGNGFQNFGTSELKSVPYAKYAQKAGNTFSGDFNDLSNVPVGLSDGDDVNDADHDPANELQTLSVSGNQLTISNGNTVILNGDNWGSQVISRDASLNGDGTPAFPLGVNTSAGIFSNWDKNAADDFSGDFNDLSNVPAGLSDGDDINDADHDATNELQNLTLSGNQLSISSGNNVTFTGWDTDASDDVQALNDLSDARATNYGVFVGNGSGTNANINGDLVGLGRNVMPNATGADYSVGIGNYALNSLTSGKYNITIGYNAGRYLQTGQSNVFIGHEAGYYETGNGNIFIGHKAGYFETGSNKLYIANSSTSSPLIGGDFATNEVTINGSLAIKDGTQGVGKVLVSDAYGKGHWSNGLPVQNKVLYLSPYDAVSFRQSDKLYRTNVGAGIYDASSFTHIYFPIKLPFGTMISTITVFYLDNSANDYHITIAKYKISNAAVTNAATYTTQGSSSGYQQHTFTINAAAGAYEQYLVDIFPKSGDHWDGNNSAISGIRVYYSE